MLQTDRTDTGRIIRHPNHGDAAGVQPELPGHARHGAGATRPFRPHSEFYNAQDSLSSTVNGQNRERNAAKLEGTDNGDNLTFLIPFGRGDRNRRRHHQQLRRGVRGGRRCGDQRHAENQARTTCPDRSSASATPRRRCRRIPSRCFPDQHVGHAERFHVGRADSAQQVVLLRRLRAHPGDSGRIRGHIPEAAFRTGDFSAAPTIIPATGNPDGTGRRPFPNNRIPPIGSAHRAAAPRHHPDAERPRRAARGDQLRATVRAVEDHQPVRHQADDLRLTASDNLAVRYSRQASNSADPGTFGQTRHLGRHQGLRGNRRAAVL